MRNKNRAGLSQAAFLGGISTMIAISLLAAGLVGTAKAPANHALPVVSVVPESRQVQEIKQTSLDKHIDPGTLQIWDPKGPGAFCPLKGTEVVADVAGFGARVTVRQTFTNPSKSPIEAIYTFPLPADAAVDRMRFAVGNRIIEGQIKRREEARRIYEAAKNAGQAAALLDQERPNIFTQSVANVMPGQDVQVEISYVQLVSFKEDWFEFHFPMVVGPRFMGNAPDPHKIGTPIVKEGMRTGAGISVKVNLDAGGPIQEVQSVLHQIQSDNTGKGRMAIQLSKKNEIPNKDFILRYRLAGNSVRDAFFTHADPQKGGFFTLALLPPQRVESADISPKEMIFVMDQSGSQGGFPIEKSKEMMRRMLQIMRPNDTFNVMGFSNACNALWAKPLPNSQENRQSALQFINSLQANGGTQLKLAIDKAMETPADPKRVRIIVFNTDGYVGDEFNILDTIQKNVGTARIFTFGIGNSVNRFLIDAMSAEGRGESQVVTLASDADKAVEAFAERMNNPVLTDIEVKIDGVPVADVLPRAIPDVFSQTPVVVKGRYIGAGRGVVHITGKLGGRPWSRDIVANFPGQDQHGSAVASLWAREKVDDLMRSDWLAQTRHLYVQTNPQESKPEPVAEQIIALALKYGIMTQYTSFVAVENRVINVGGKHVTVHVPVEMADGVSYEGIFGGDRNREELGRKAGSTAMYGKAIGGGGGGFGGAAAGPPATSSLGLKAGKSIGNVSYADKAELADSYRYLNPASFKQGFDKMTDRQVASLSGIDRAQEEAVTKDLTPTQRARYFKLTRVDKSLWKAAGKVQVQIWTKGSPADLSTKLKAMGMTVHLTDASLKAVFVTVDAKDLTAIAQMEGVVRVLPLKG